MCLVFGETEFFCEKEGSSGKEGTGAALAACAAQCMQQQAVVAGSSRGQGGQLDSIYHSMLGGLQLCKQLTPALPGSHPVVSQQALQGKHAIEGALVKEVVLCEAAWHSAGRSTPLPAGSYRISCSFCGLLGGGRSGGR